MRSVEKALPPRRFGGSHWKWKPLEDGNRVPHLKLEVLSPGSHGKQRVVGSGTVQPIGDPIPRVALRTHPNIDPVAAYQFAHKDGDAVFKRQQVKVIRCLSSGHHRHRPHQQPFMDQRDGQTGGAVNDLPAVFREGTVFQVKAANEIRPL